MVARSKDTLLLIGSRNSARPDLRNIFSQSYDILEADNVPQALLLMELNYECIVAVLADLPIAEETIEPLAAACTAHQKAHLPLILLTDNTGAQEELAFLLGAADVVLKPYTPAAVRRRVQILIDNYLHNCNLEQRLFEQSAAIRNTNQVMLDALSAIIEHRSAESGNHILRIRSFTRLLLEEVAHTCPEYELDDRSINIISNAAALHDIGKISIPDAILNKPGRLTAEEYTVMKSHCAVGAEMLQNLAGMGDAEYLRYAYNICLYHHERWDGHGYPKRLQGDEIPICAQVVGLADVYDALTSPRVYKPALSHEQAVNMILNGECGAFSPRLLACFKSVRPAYADLAAHYADGASPRSFESSMTLPSPALKAPSLDSLQIAQLKYQTLLHYVDDTVLELDLAGGAYHVVYNPNPDIDALVPHALNQGILSQLGDASVHPDDRAVSDEIAHCLHTEFFAQNLRRKTFAFRIFSPIENDYVPYELTFLRVNTGDDDQRIVLAIWHRIRAFARKERGSLHGSPALEGLESSILRCRPGRDMQIDAGAENLYLLTGYTPAEIDAQFGGCLRNLLLPEDVAQLETAIAESRHSGSICELEFRLLCRKDAPRWVRDRLRVYVDEDEQEYIFHALCDNSQAHRRTQALQDELQRNQLVFEQMDSFPFVLDMIRDHMTSSPKWADHFGYEPRSENFLSELSHSHFHPDDIGSLRRMIEDMKNGRTSASVEVRLINGEGKYLWCRFSGTGQYDETGRLCKIIGLLTDIDEQKRTTISLKQQAERDPLTHLLNKASTQQFASAYLEAREHGHIAAMLMLDLDNFKLVNDHYGHLYGDNLLKQVGINLRSLFRSDDIIGRIGGDEFLILLKDIPGEAFIRERCELLLRQFHQLRSELIPDLDCSWSIGVALAPTHGQSYGELFRHADEALYLAKKSGKDTFRIYSDSAMPPLSSDVHTLTRIDSEERPGLADNAFVLHVFHRLYESRDIEQTIDELLAHIGQELNVSRVYIFENNEDNTCCNNTFEWCNEGIEPQIDNLQQINYADDIPGWIEAFDERGIIYCSNIENFPPHIRAIVEPQGNKSMLVCSILDKGVFRGYVGFDECTVDRMWTQDQIDLLRFLSEVLALFLLKHRSQSNALQYAENLTSILNNQDAWIYVIDPTTHKVHFANEKLRQRVSDRHPELPCYAAFTGRTTPCAGCPAVNILQDQNVVSVVENRSFGILARTTATHISWNGCDACLISCRALENEK